MLHQRTSLLFGSVLVRSSESVSLASSLRLESPSMFARPTIHSLLIRSLLQLRRKPMSKASRLGTIVAVLIAWLLASSPAPAQTNFGQLNGTIQDQTGNVVPGAQVTLKNLDTGTERQATSSGTGSYVILTVPPARYSLSVTLSGFQTYLVPEFKLQVNESRTIDVQMALGAVTETVEVTASPVAVNRTDATIGTVIQNQEIVEIPLNGRNFAQLILLAPGASPAAVGQQTAFGITGGFSPAVNGMRHMMNNFTLDGVENNMRFTNSFGTAPPPDALEEFKISGHQSDAAASLAAGANVNLVTRSGTNDFHGSVWNFLRNDVLSANGFFNNFFGRGKLPFRQNQYGFFVGGPVTIPHVINGRNSKTYFAGYFEGLKFRRESATTATVPSEAVRRGDFSELLGSVIGPDCLGREVRQGQIYDPFTTRPNSNCPGGLVRDPFPGNVLPRVHPVAQAWMRSIYPLPNQSGIPNLVLSQRTKQDSDQWGIRIDQNFSDRQLFFGRFSKYHFTRRTPSPLPANVALNLNSGANLAVHYSFIFSPTLLYDFTGGYNRATIPFGQEPLGKEFRDAVGENFAAEVPLGFLPSSQSLFGSRYNFAQFVFYDLANPDDAFQFNNSLKKVKGKHSLSMGFNILHWRHHVGVQGTSSFQYSPVTTSLPGFPATGESMASFFVGLPTASSFGFGAPKTTHGNVYVGYFGDTWKVTSKFAATLGLQYVYSSPPVGNSEAAMDIDLARTQPLATDFAFAYLWTSTNPITNAPPNAPRGIINPDRNNLAPRVALAYSAFKDTVIRTGFGIFYDYNTNLIQNNHARGFAYPFAVTRAIGGQNLSGPGPASPPVSLDNPYVPFSPSRAALGAAVDRFRRDPYAMNWNFGIEQMLPANMLLSADYVGAGGRKLSTNVQQNMAPAGPDPINPRRPWPNSPNSFFLTQHIGNSNYHSLQLKLERRFSNGLTFRNSYTWSRSLDIDSDPNSAVLDYSYDLRYSYGPSTFHIPHVNVTSFVYQLPFGRGKRFGSQVPGILNHIIGGWQFSGIASIRSGLPYHILSGQDSANTGNFIAFATTRAQIVSPAVPSGFDQKREQWIDKNAFRIPTFGTLGNMSRSSLTGPSFQNFDFAVSKDFRFNESFALEFRGEFFNAFNHTNFGNPINTLASPLLGQILSAFAARDIQFALKLHW